MNDSAYFSDKAVTKSGAYRFWLEVDEILKQFDLHEISLKPIKSEDIKDQKFKLPPPPPQRRASAYFYKNNHDYHRKKDKRRHSPKYTHDSKGNIGHTRNKHSESWSSAQNRYNNKKGNHHDRNMSAQRNLSNYY